MSLADHKDVARVFTEIDAETGEDALVVETNLALDYLDPRYNTEAVDALLSAVYEHLRKAMVPRRTLIRNGSSNIPIEPPQS